MARNEFKLGFEFRGRRFKDAQKGLNAFAEELGVAVSTLNPVIQRELKDMLDTVAAAMKARHSTPWTAGRKLPSGKRTGKLARRSGKLLRSIADSVKVTGAGDEIKGEIGAKGFGATHERGATIRAKKAKFLTIPLPAALDSRGIPKKRRARDWPNTFVIKSKRGNLLIVQRKGKGLLPLYLLRKSVRIPPRLGLGATLEKAVPIFVDRLFDRLVREVNKKI